VNPCSLRNLLSDMVVEPPNGLYLDWFLINYSAVIIVLN